MPAGKAPLVGRKYVRSCDMSITSRTPTTQSIDVPKIVLATDATCDIRRGHTSHSFISFSQENRHAEISHRHSRLYTRSNRTRDREGKYD